MKFARIAAPVAALLLVAGCSSPTGGTAFEVQGERVSSNQVDAATQGCSRLLDAGEQEIKQQISGMMLSGALADAVAERTGTAITPQSQDKAIDALQARSLLKDPDCAVPANSIARYAVVAQALGEKKLGEQVRALDVQVNPRLGQWDADRGAIVGSTGSLSVQDLGQGVVGG